MESKNSIEQVAFPALIKEISIKSLVSGDKEARLILQFLPTDDILNGLNHLHRADKQIMVAFVPIKNTGNNNTNAIQKRTKRKPTGETQGGEV